jgi:hypothetical protein
MTSVIDQGNITFLKNPAYSLLSCKFNSNKNVLSNQYILGTSAQDYHQAYFKQKRQKIKTTVCGSLVNQFILMLSTTLIFIFVHLYYHQYPWQLLLQVNFFPTTIAHFCYFLLVICTIFFLLLFLSQLIIFLNKYYFLVKKFQQKKGQYYCNYRKCIVPEKICFYCFPIHKKIGSYSSNVKLFQILPNF